MKRIRVGLVMFIILILLQPVMALANGPTADEEMRGMWIASVLNIDYPSKGTADPDTLKQEAIKILDKAENIGINAVFLQVRPTADAFYPSKYFPWSKYLTGTQGLSPDNYFDPLQYWIDEAHSRNIEVHAWINPYRITKKTKNDPEHDWDSLTNTHPAKLNSEWVVSHTDGNLYFNPGLPEVRKLIIDSTLEIINNYDIDGIHFDDYFYPGRTFADESTYEKYGSGFASLQDWRRENVNLLISDLYKAIKEKDQSVQFGISPFGIWANKGSNALGSDTRGAESYNDHYADSRTWVKSGYIDYITPQIYWNIGYTIADYQKLLNWWADVVRDTDVKLYVGQAAYRTESSKTDSPWSGVAEIGRQLELNAQTPEVRGSIFYNTSAMMKKPALSSLVQSYYSDNKVVKSPTKPLSVGRPTQDIKTNYKKYYLNGTSDPKMPLYLNGNLVETRSDQGYFGILVPLNVGINKFVFTQGNTSYTRTITKNPPWTPTAMNKIEISSKTAFPTQIEYRMPGEKITLSCIAPIGAIVKVKINGDYYNMTPRTTNNSSSSTYGTKYTYLYEVPNVSGNPRKISLGKPVYTMTYKGIESTKQALGEIAILMKGAPYYAEVVSEVADTYKTPPSSNGSLFEIYKGMFESVTAVSGDYVRFENGLWTKKKFVKLIEASVPKSGIITQTRYSVGEKEDIFYINTTDSVMTTAKFDGQKILVDLVQTTSQANVEIPTNGLIKDVLAEVRNNDFRYILNLKEGFNIGGYYVEKTIDGVAVHIKREVRANYSQRPLEGITIMLDPGHGGKDSGALGPMGLKYSEKHFNLEAGLRLEKELQNMGANVLMTRKTDTYLSLPARLALSRKARPDLFVSIHADSMADNVDISKIHGFSVYYHEVFAKEPANTILSRTINNLNRKDRGSHDKLFYVVRGTWAPSILFETGFIPNPNEFEWLTDEAEQSKFTKNIADAILSYFLK